MSLSDIRAQLELRRRDFYGFVRGTFPEFVDGWVYADLCGRLRQFMLDVRAGKSPRLIVCLPPRMGKSQLSTIRFALFCLLNNPRWEIIVASYSAKLVNRFSRAARSLVESSEYVKTLWPKAKLSDDHASIEEWRVEIEGDPVYLGGGTYRAVGRGGSITGSGAHCLVAGTGVMCYGYTRNIESLVSGEIVLSVNHKTGKSEWRKILATKESLSNGEIIEIETTGGRKFRCTAEHRIFTGNGYKVATECRAGELLCSAPSLSGVLDVPGNIYNPEVRFSQEISPWAQGYVLFCKLFGVSPRSKEQKKMSPVRYSRGKENSEVLQEVQAKCEQSSVTGQNLSNLRSIVSTETFSNSVLFDGMQGQKTLKRDAWEWKSSLHKWKQLHYSVSKIIGSCARAGRQAVSSVRENWRSCSPHRSRQTQQHHSKPDNNVSFMSHYTPQIACDTISSIKRISAGKIKVYDIQVEENSNFFAEGILVHNCLILDDLIKDHQEADSHITHQSIWDWYSSTARTRLSPGGGVLLVMTRWNVSDLIGRLLDEERKNPEADKWDLVNYQAIAEKDEKDRKEGESLLPARWSAEDFLKIKANTAPRWWDALYQQNPITKGGNLFKEIYFKRYFAAPEQFDHVVCVWDLRFGKSQKKTTSFVCGWVIGMKGGQFWVLDERRDRWSFAESRDQVKAMAAEWPEAMAKVLENKANGPALESDLEEYVSGIVLYDPRGDKYQRAERVLPLCMAGNVFLPADEVAPWAKEALVELTTFPSGANDDRVDCLSMGLSYLLENATGSYEVRAIE